ncbi:DUF4304 domain-containing protein [Geothrix oryzisoli]|uniref:DUF4304 domain-containing protein n=1 Tax=Geothrix oryzisoli TaxID=2922721 RepID=UPI001FADD2D3|nr:DUF4304 domain-containing protein [Geothrix oryzisoli]
MGRTTALRSALKAVFYPYVEARGFILDTSNQPWFTTFRRHQGDKVHVFDIQWDKYGGPRFVLNFGEAPANGLVRQHEPIAPQHIDLCDCQPRLRLQRRRGGTMGCWFQLRRPLWEQFISLSREYRPEEVAHRVTASFAEVETWWATRVQGPHVHGIGHDA